MLHILIFDYFLGCPGRLNQISRKFIKSSMLGSIQPPWVSSLNLNAVMTTAVVSKFAMQHCRHLNEEEARKRAEWIVSSSSVIHRRERRPANRSTNWPAYKRPIENMRLRDYIAGQPASQLTIHPTQYRTHTPCAYTFSEQIVKINVWHWQWYQRHDAIPWAHAQIACIVTVYGRHGWLRNCIILLPHIL